MLLNMLNDLAEAMKASDGKKMSAETVRDWAVGEECPLFSSSRSLGWGLGGSDPPKSTSSSKLPAASGDGARM